MAEKVKEMYVIKDTKSGKYLSNIWLARDMKDVSFFLSMEDVENHISQIRMRRFVPKGGTGFFAKDLIIVKVEEYSNGEKKYIPLEEC